MKAAIRISLNPKYRPLKNLQTRYAVVTGGRGSGKSFAISTLLLMDTFKVRNKTILFTRYTMKNAETSIIPEFNDKIEKGNMSSVFHKSGDSIVNLRTGTMILFRGIKTSEGINTAALKSIPNLWKWVNDESEEFVNEDVFDTIDDSIRASDVHCEVWIVLNPKAITHFIYRKFFALNGVSDVCNMVKGDVTYIHTCYLDNPYLPADYKEKADKCMLADPDKYWNNWLGHWKMLHEGIIYKNWEEITDEQYPSGLPQWYGNDWGYSDDPDALCRMCYEPVSGTLYVKQLAYSTGMLPRDVARVIIDDGRSIGLNPEDCIVYCDPARPEAIAELRVIYGINALPANNRDKSGRIAWLRGFRVKYVGADIGREQSTYSYKPDKNDPKRFTDVPQDGNDHAMDCINYGACTHLRVLGITNDVGDR